jgi:hypothetical protein
MIVAISIGCTQNFLPEERYRMAGKQKDEEYDDAKDCDDSYEAIECDLLALRDGNPE